MHFPRHWSRATVDDEGREVPGPGFTAYGWSDHGDAEAHRHAVDRARRIARWYTDQQTPQDPGLPDDYYQRPFREPVIEQVPAAGGPHSVLSRNVYGSYVLNCPDVLFADIDAPPPPRVRTTWWQRLLGYGHEVYATDRRSESERAEALLDMLRPIVQRRGLTCRLYRTAAGYRAAVVNRRYPAASTEALALLREMHSDTRYVTLCQAQNCFRARLTPKPWRMQEMTRPRPPARFPVLDTAQRETMDRWIREYEAAIPRYSVCRLIEQIGPHPVDPGVGEVLSYHDQMACGGGPLA